MNQFGAIGGQTRTAHRMGGGISIDSDQSPPWSGRLENPQRMASPADGQIQQVLTRHRSQTIYHRFEEDRIVSCHPRLQ
jgi:hypothetical protein